MNYFEIVSDTSNDLPRSYLEDKAIRQASFYICLDGENYLRDQVDIDRKGLYEKLREDSKLYPKTSLPSIMDYIDVFRDILESGRDILCFTVSSILSGSYESANMAAKILEEDYKNKIYIVDSKSASLGSGILIKYAVEMREKNHDLATIYEKLEELSSLTRIYMALDNLSYLEKGGRLSKAGALAGSFLKLKPIASFIDNTLKIEGATRGEKKAVGKLLDLAKDYIISGDYDLFIIHGDARDRAERLREEIREDYGLGLIEEPALVSGAVISHIGPGAVALGLVRKMD